MAKEGPHPLIAKNLPASSLTSLQDQVMTNSLQNLSLNYGRTEKKFSDMLMSHATPTGQTQQSNFDQLVLSFHKFDSAASDSCTLFLNDFGV